MALPTCRMHTTPPHKTLAPESPRQTSRIRCTLRSIRRRQSCKRKDIHILNRARQIQLGIKSISRRWVTRRLGTACNRACIRTAFQRHKQLRWLPQPRRASRTTHYRVRPFLWVTPVNPQESAAHLRRWSRVVNGLHSKCPQAWADNRRFLHRSRWPKCRSEE